MTLEDLQSLLEYNSDSGSLKYVISRAGHVQKGMEAGVKLSNGYRQIQIKGKKLYAHRIAWAMFYKEKPPKIIDHINGIKHDNRIANLRAATGTQNRHNSKIPITNTSGIKGIHYDGRYWVAKIFEKGCPAFSKYCKTKDEAINAIKLAKENIQGEYQYGSIRG